MSTVRSANISAIASRPVAGTSPGADRQIRGPLVSLVVPAFNEAAIITKSLTALCRYMESLEGEYRWEIVVINDGSTDETAELAEAFARSRDNVHVLHHKVNCGLGRALKSAFQHCEGEYIVTVDIDLSYSPDHIGKLLSRIGETDAQLVVASPYLKGGQISNVPWLRRTCSIWANRFLSVASKGSISTLTGMTRVHKARFLKTLSLRSPGMGINSEVIYKAMLLGAQIEEIPAHLKWQTDGSAGIKRRSSMRLARHTLAILQSGFLFRPVMFFIVPGCALLGFAVYVEAWMFAHFLTHYQKLSEYSWFFSRASVAVAAAYSEFPHTFFVGGLALMLAVQFLSLGIISLQNKSYFEEIFDLASGIYELAQDGEGEKQ